MGYVGVDCEATIRTGQLFDMELLLDHAAGGYRAMDERAVTRVLLTFEPSGWTR